MQTRIFDMNNTLDEINDKCNIANVKISKHEDVGIETIKMKHTEKGEF